VSCAASPSLLSAEWVSQFDSDHRLSDGRFPHSRTQEQLHVVAARCSQDIWLRQRFASGLRNAAQKCSSIVTFPSKVLCV
jgi:hypothetical protein